MDIKPLLKLMAEKNASDLFFTPMAAIKIKIEGQIMSLGKDLLTVDQVRDAAHSIMNEHQKDVLERELEIDFAISLQGMGRFRANVFRQRGNLAMVLRFVTLDVPRLDDIRVPPILEKLTMRKRGMVLMVGATGSGKSTTIAAMINHRNEHTANHIITIVNQRELGLDTKSYARALKSAMREAPDVVVIGEIRDRETMQAAITLAGTGHLCVATLHANNASETLDRIINMFPQNQHQQLFMDLSHYLNAIVAQRLVIGKDKKRLPAVEVLINTPHVSDLTMKGDVTGVKEALIESLEEGMQSFDVSLYQLYKDGKIDLDTALENADSSADLEAKINFG
jgi:twitching motility protein PilU